MAESHETILLREPADLTAVTLTVALRAHHLTAVVDFIQACTRLRLHELAPL